MRCGSWLSVLLGCTSSAGCELLLIKCGRGPLARHELCGSSAHPGVRPQSIRADGADGVAIASARHNLAATAVRLSVAYQRSGSLSIALNTAVAADLAITFASAILAAVTVAIITAALTCPTECERAEFRAVVS